MASATVNSGSVSVNGTGTVLAVGMAPVPDGPAHIKVATGTGKRIVVDFVGLAVADINGFSVNDTVTLADGGSGSTTITN